MKLSGVVRGGWFQDFIDGIQDPEVWAVLGLVAAFNVVLFVIVKATRYMNEAWRRYDGDNKVMALFRALPAFLSRWCRMLFSSMWKWLCVLFVWFWKRLHALFRIPAEDQVIIYACVWALGWGAFPPWKSVYDGAPKDEFGPIVSLPGFPRPEDANVDLRHLIEIWVAIGIAGAAGHLLIRKLTSAKKGPSRGGGGTRGA